MEKGILRAVVACGLLFGAINVSAFDKVEAAPFVKGEINGNYTETDWMKHIPGSTYVCHVTIPGTHDTATGEGFVSETAASRSQTQNKTIVEQINAGIRGLDFRPNLKKGVLKCCHGADETNKPFAEAIDELKAFLEAHPSEFFVIHLLKAGSSADYKAAIYEFFNQEQYAGLFVNFRRDLTVDDLRGKILIFNRNEDFPVPFGGDLIWWHE